jgi:drug/metabolite transporter (DMT)-like permease
MAEAAGSDVAKTDRGAGAVAERGGVGLILFAMLCFALQDVTVKGIAGDVSLWQLQAVRSAVTVLILTAVWRVFLSRDRLVPRRWRWPFIRAVFMSGAYLFFYASLPLLTLTQAVSAFFVGPLLITLLAALLLGERIGPRRIVAVVAGFGGVLLIVRPGGAEFEAAALLPVAAAVCYALGVVTTRWRCAGESSLSLTMTHNLLYTAIGVGALALVPLLPIGAEARAAWPFIATGWHAASLAVFAAMVATAFTHVGGMMSSIAAYRRDEASRIAPFEYTYLAIMPVFDLVLFAEAPRVETLAGMALIAGSGAFVAWREGRPPRPRMVPRVEDPWTTPDDRAK